MDFPGPDEEPDKTPRLTRQHEAILDLMADGEWRLLDEISRAVEATGVRCPPASTSAQLRHLRKAQFGSHTVLKQHVCDGLYEYKLVVTEKQQPLF